MTVRDTVRDTFTPSRVGILSWAFAAVLMGTVGLASYQFGNRPISSASLNTFPSGLPLPPAGDIETTASVSQGLPIEILQVPEIGKPRAASNLEQSQIEVLQREIVGLRRRLSALSEQNISYSKRIAVLERQATSANLSELGDSGKIVVKTREPDPGAIITEAIPNAPMPRGNAVSPASDADMTAKNTDQSPATRTSASTEPNSASSLPSRRINIYQAPPATSSGASQDEGRNEPVRIVNLPQTADEPVVTGSIPTRRDATAPELFDSTPTRTTLEPTVITPSGHAGRLRGGGDSQIKRSDFGAVIGHYRSTAAAAKAWADFKDQNEERMRDLRPLLLERQTPEGGISLLVGPFGNAADAAVACVLLLDVTELCRPALFAGDPLVTAAKFRDSAF